MSKTKKARKARKAKRCKETNIKSVPPIIITAEKEINRNNETTPESILNFINETPKRQSLYFQMKQDQIENKTPRLKSQSFKTNLFENEEKKNFINETIELNNTNSKMEQILRKISPCVLEQVKVTAFTDCNKVKTTLQPTKTKVTPENLQSKSSEIYFTPVLNKTRNISPFFNSTPKPFSFKSKHLLQENNKMDAIVHSNISAITSDRQEEKDNISLIPFQKEDENNTKKNTKFFNYISLYQLYNWLNDALKKGQAMLKQFFNIRRNSNIGPCQKCEEKISELNLKITRVETEFKKQINDLREEIKNKVAQNKGEIIVASAPPPPPPPLPPPITMPLNFPIEKINRPLPARTAKENIENVRPLITVEDLKNVKLKKTARDVSSRKSIHGKTDDMMFKQVKLRSLSRQRSKDNGSSPNSSLAKILQNVDLNSKSGRRIKKTHFLSVDYFSRSPSFRYRLGNDSAPIV